MISEELSCNLFLLSNHFTKHSLLLLEGLFRVKGQAHSLESTHATCHQYCDVNKGKTHFLSTMKSWPMDHMQATREKMLPCSPRGCQRLEKQVSVRALKQPIVPECVIPRGDISTFWGKKLNVEYLCILITLTYYFCLYFQKRLHV